MRRLFKCEDGGIFDIDAVVTVQPHDDRDGKCEPWEVIFESRLSDPKYYVLISQTDYERLQNVWKQEFV